MYSASESDYGSEERWFEVDTDGDPFPTGSNWNDSWDSQAIGDDTIAVDMEDGAASSPGVLLVLAYVANAVSLVFLLIGFELLNWFGYVSSGYLASALIVAYWYMDQQRRLSPNYSFAGHRTAMSVLSVVVGLAMVVMHSLALSENVVPI